MAAIPTLSKDSLRQVYFCSFTPMKDRPELRAWFEGHGKSLFAVVNQSGEPNVYLRRLGNVDRDDDGHFHIEAAVEDVFRGRNPTRIDSQPDDLFSNFGILAAKELAGRIFGKYHIRMDSPAAKRIAKALLGASIDISGYSLALSGATFDVSGDGPLFRVRWSLQEDTEILVLELHLIDLLEIDDQLLINAAGLLDTAFKALSNPHEIFKKAQDA